MSDERPGLRPHDDHPDPAVAAPGAVDTAAIRVVVTPLYLEEQSVPSEDHYVWAYHVRIENLGSATVQLLNRHWRITDAKGRARVEPRARRL